MTSEERQKLKNRIFESIRAYDKRRSLWIYSSVAASIALIAGFFYFNSMQNFNNLPAAYHTAAAEDFENITDVVLQLSENENVLIKDDSSRIEYSSDDHAIKISNSKTIRKEEIAANSYNTLIVPYGKRSEIILSDGTKVWLNSGSKLVYPSFFSGSKREVFLIGEAIFDVVENKEKPFYVSTNDYVVKVLGTVFNISNYPDDAFTSTVLKSGLVQIDYREKGVFRFKKSIELLPGNKATYQRGNDKLITSKVDVDPYFSWKDGVLMFKNDPLENIIKRVSRYYNVEVLITSDELKHERFSGHLNLKEDIIQVIEVINESAGQVFEIERTENDKHIRLTKM